MVRLVSESASKSEGRVNLDEPMSELAEKRAMKAWLLPSGVAEFSDGKVAGLIDEDAGQGVHRASQSGSESPKFRSRHGDSIGASEWHLNDALFQRL